MKQWGFSNLICIDRFCDSSQYGKDITFIKKDICEYESEAKYDLITLHHSFEHMENPDDVLKKIHSLLKDDGLLLIRIPVCGGEAWKRYHEYWWQIDAPRHYFLYSVKSMNILAERNGFKIEQTVYDSEYRQFTVSDYYKKTDMSLQEIHNFDEIKSVKNPFISVVKYNKRGEGDSAGFYLRKSNCVS